ncbi:hypothetical protein [Porphyromonas gulae]|uniref:hypothetical protein n=2 Tax=Porphyromonas TaxID=836 RepID=UPI000ACE4BA8|nr:hypothetical protein [Porphyromonas gulae]
MGKFSLLNNFKAYIVSAFKSICNIIKSVFGGKKNNGLIPRSECLLNKASCSHEDMTPQNQKVLISSIELKNSEASVVFKAADENDLKNLSKLDLSSKQKELFLGTFSSIIGGASNVAIGSFAANGLFKATVNPSTLMKLSSGGVSSAVVNNGTIVQQAGFLPAGTTFFTPMVLFQITSFVTGQYYMNGMTKQLNAALEKLDTLIEFYYRERMAKIKQSVSLINKNLSNKIFSDEDLQQMKDVHSDLSIIKNEFFEDLSCMTREMSKKNKRNPWGKLKAAKSIEKEKAKFIHKMEILLFVEALLYLTKVTELYMNIRYIQPDMNRLNWTLSALIELSTFREDDLFSMELINLHETVKKEILEYLSDLEKGPIFTSKIREIKSNFENSFVDIEEHKDNLLSEAKEIHKSTLVRFEKDKMFVIDFRNGNLELYSSNDQ